MSYLVLARKWRPQTFEDVIGQGHVTRTLQNALKSDRVAHALLFSGPRGVGKTSVARILSKALNCENGPAPVPCNQCSICRQITAGHNVDVNEIDGASNRGIDEIRQLREDIRFQPAQCRFRIYIIDEVHMLTKEAFNALLKTLEEPPPHAFFIFATTEPRKIPPTIHSRCQHFEFRRLPEEELADHLDKIVEKEGLNLPRRATLLLAREAEGSVRDSLSLLDQVAAFGARSYEDVCEALGVIDIETVEGLALSILESDIPAVLATLDRVYKLGSDLQKVAEDLLKFLRDLAIIKRLTPEQALELVEMDEKRIESVRAKFRTGSFHQVLQAMQILSASMDELYRSREPRMVLEVLLLRLCTLREFSGIDELIQKVEGLLKVYQESGGTCEIQAPYGDKPRQTVPEEPLPARGMQTVSPSASRTETNAETPVEQGRHFQQDPPVTIEAGWQDFIEAVKSRKPSIGSALEACPGFKATDDSAIEIQCRPDMTGDMLRDRNSLNLLTVIAREVFKRPIKISFKAKPDARPGPRGSKGKNSTRQGQSRREQLINSPLVQETINLFQARISNVTLYYRRNYKKERKEP